jgi:hypothetical protein
MLKEMLNRAEQDKNLKVGIHLYITCKYCSYKFAINFNKTYNLHKIYVDVAKFGFVNVLVYENI